MFSGDRENGSETHCLQRSLPLKSIVTTLMLVSVFVSMNNAMS